MNKNVFKTTDLPLATFLKCNDIDLYQETPYNLSTKEWIFTNTEECEKLVCVLANGSGSVKVLEYEMHRKNLLSIAKRFSPRS